MSATVRLRNGAELPAPLAAACWDALRDVWREQPVVMLALLTKFFEPQYRIAPGPAAVLAAAGLLSPTGFVADAARDVLASALVGAGPDLALGSPWAREGVER